jgi:RNA polymerase sigma-70 factor (ECF subfamily)
MQEVYEMGVDLDALARRAQAGDRSAFAELYGATHRELRIFVSAHAASADMVDEVLQATYVACWQSLRMYQLRGTFVPWLKGIARHHLLKALREQSRNMPLTGLIYEDALNRIERVSADPEPLDECLRRLSPAARDLLERRYAARAPLGAIAQALGRTKSWVAVTLFRIRETLRRCLAEQKGSA